MLGLRERQSGHTALPNANNSKHNICRTLTISPTSTLPTLPPRPASSNSMLSELHLQSSMCELRNLGLNTGHSQSVNRQMQQEITHPIALPPSTSLHVSPIAWILGFRARFRVVGRGFLCGMRIEISSKRKRLRFEYLILDFLKKKVVILKHIDIDFEIWNP